MANEIQAFEQQLNQLSADAEALLQNLADLRRQSPKARGEAAKLMENAMIALSKRAKQISREYNDDLMEGISFLKIKMMG